MVSGVCARHPLPIHLKLKILNGPGDGQLAGYRPGNSLFIL
jgi:hypothetical protein